MTQDTTSADRHAAAWAFILRWKDRLPKLAHRYCGALSKDDREAFLHDVIVYVADKHHRYDPSRSAEQTWLVWQIRAVSTSWTRRYRRQLREGVGQVIGDKGQSPLILVPVPDDAYGSTEHSQQVERQQDAAVQVAGLYALATARQRAAMQSILAGMDAGTLRDRHGMTVRERNSHLRALRAHLEM